MVVRNDEESDGKPHRSRRSLAADAEMHVIFRLRCDNYSNKKRRMGIGGVKVMDEGRMMLRMVAGLSKPFPKRSREVDS